MNHHSRQCERMHRRTWCANWQRNRRRGIERRRSKDHPNLIMGFWKKQWNVNDDNEKKGKNYKEDPFACELH